MQAKKLRIVLADDDPGVRKYFSLILQQLGHTPFPVEDGDQLVEACRSIDPDLVISDIRMPGLDGIDAAKEVCQHKSTPFILVSGYHDSETLARVGNGMILGYLVKPVKLPDIEAAIAVAMNRFEKFFALEQKNVQLLQTLEERKLIERAKGSVMKRLRVDEEEAFQTMRRFATCHQCKLVDAARHILSADDVFRSFESQ